MSKFAKGINSKMQRTITQKIKFSSGNLIITLYQLSKFDLLAVKVTVFEISSFLWQNLQRAITQQKIKRFFKISTRLSTHYPL